MKILVVSAGYPPRACGGYELACRAVVDELARRGHEVSVLTSPSVVAGGRTAADLVPSIHRDLAWTHAPVRRAWAIPRWDLWVVGNPGLLRRMIERLDPAVGYLWNLSGTGILTMLWAVSESGRPVVIHLMDYWLSDLVSPVRDGRPRFHPFLRPFLLGLLAFVRRAVARVTKKATLLAMSQTVVQAHRSVGFEPRLVRHGVRISDELPPKNSLSMDQDLVLVVLGRLIRGKGVHVAIEALALASGRIGGFRLDIIGEGDASYKADLERQVESLGLAGHVRFLGALGHDEVLSRLPIYDAMLFPTLRVEPMGIVILEAMAFGVVVIASRSGGPAELFEDRSIGVLVPPGDPGALGEALRQFRDEPEQMLRIRRDAWKFMRETHGIGASVDEIEKSLREAIGPPARG